MNVYDNSGIDTTEQKYIKICLKVSGKPYFPSISTKCEKNSTEIPDTSILAKSGIFLHVSSESVKMHSYYIYLLKNKDILTIFFMLIIYMYKKLTFLYHFSQWLYPNRSAWRGSACIIALLPLRLGRVTTLLGLTTELRWLEHQSCTACNWVHDSKAPGSIPGLGNLPK